MSGPQQAISGNRLPPHGTHANPPGDLNLTDLVLQLREDIRGMREDLAGLDERVTGSDRTVQGMVGRIAALEGVMHEPRRDQAVERPQHQRPLSPAAPWHSQPRAALAGDGRGLYIDYDLDNFEEEIDENPRDHDIQNARIEAPSFDGSLEPQDYLDWEARMNRYFDWLGMLDPRRGFFAKTMLRGRVLTYWTNLEERLAQRFEEPIDTWDEMKARLREKYVPATYRHRLIDRWQSISSTNQRPLDPRATLGPTPRVPSNRVPEGQRPGEVPPTLPPPRRDDRGKEQPFVDVDHEGDGLADEYEGKFVGVGEPADLVVAPKENRLGVVRCILAQPKETEDWRRTAILQTYCRLGGRVCRVIINSGSCINAISTSTVAHLGLTTEDHPRPYQVSWVDTTSIPVRLRCLVPIHLQSYEAQIWCDVLPMEVGIVILGRPWIYDTDAALYGRSNTCVFKHGGHRITIHPSRPCTVPSLESPAPTSPSVAATPQVDAPGDPSSSQPSATTSATVPLAGKPPSARTPKRSTPTSMTLQLITAREFEHELFDYDVIYALMVREVDDEGFDEDLKKLCMRILGLLSQRGGFPRVEAHVSTLLLLPPTAPSP
ncbi:hypothetical protein Taro_023661 [Colocasia esculenta]|uniref:Retrotransposon gag domain-containing protein n=1 Tax=Colocasia esculenta TaxID=4460 RepID=A0A843V8Z6_COLES|nr:hypothetical protein [Colocasia esculenta]